MPPERLHALLRGLYHRPRANPRRRAALEANLLEHHARRHPRVRSSTGGAWIPRWAVVIAISVAVVIGACRMPVQYEVGVGERLALVLPYTQKTHVEIDPIEAYIAGVFPSAQLEVQVHPGLSGARVEEEEIEGTIRGTLGGLISHELLDVIIDREGVEAARATIIERLAAQGLDARADVEVQATGDGSRRKVKIRVEARPLDARLDARLDDATSTPSF